MATREQRRAELAAECEEEAAAAEEWEGRFLRQFDRDDLTDAERAQVAADAFHAGSRAREYRDKAAQHRSAR
jgi:hypothetical protein